MLSNHCISSVSILPRTLRPSGVCTTVVSPFLPVRGLQSPCAMHRNGAACSMACPTSSLTISSAQPTALTPPTHVVHRSPSSIYVQTCLIWTCSCHVLPTASGRGIPSPTAPWAVRHPHPPPEIHLRVHDALRSPFQTLLPHCTQVWQLLRLYHVHFALLHRALGMVRMRISEVVCAPLRTPEANTQPIGLRYACAPWKVRLQLVAVSGR